MSEESDDSVTHFGLEIEGRSPVTEILFSVNAGHLVQMELGTLRSRLIPGNYVVEFGLGTTCYPIPLRENVRLTQGEIEAGSSCERPEESPQNWDDYVSFVREVGVAEPSKDSVQGPVELGANGANSVFLAWVSDKPATGRTS